MSKAISILVIVWLALFALGTWSQAEDFVKPPASSGRPDGYLTKEEMKRCVILYNEVKDLDDELAVMAINPNLKYHQHLIDEFNNKVTRLEILNDRYNDRCAGKSEVTDDVMRDLNRQGKTPVHIPSEKEKIKHDTVGRLIKMWYDKNPEIVAYLKGLIRGAVGEHRRRFFIATGEGYPIERFNNEMCKINSEENDTLSIEILDALEGMDTVASLSMIAAIVVNRHCVKQTGFDPEVTEIPISSGMPNLYKF